MPSMGDLTSQLMYVKSEQHKTSVRERMRELGPRGVQLSAREMGCASYGTLAFQHARTIEALGYKFASGTSLLMWLEELPAEVKSAWSGVTAEAPFGLFSKSMTDLRHM